MKELSYKTKELCEKNKRYNKFNTVLPSVFDYKNLIKNVIDKNNFYDNKKLRETFNIIIDSKLNSDVYNFINYDSMISTANYLFYMLGVGIYVEIKDNKIKTFLPFNNLDFNNNITSKIKLPSKYKDLNDFYKKKIVYILLIKNNIIFMIKINGMLLIVYFILREVKTLL